jgi:TupA-like ATPgrasp
MQKHSGPADENEVRSRMYPPGFDRERSKSPFLDFIAGEFHERGTQRRRELGQKMISHPFVSELGMRVPERLAVLDEIETLHDTELPDFFVLKLAEGWSARGVMILERTDADRYFDHMNLQVHTAGSIAAVQREKALSFEGRKPRWIVEESVKPLLGIGAIPFDYKFYCFSGEVGLVVQIDRNSHPTKIVLFDGEFRPLKRGTDYLLSEAANPGVPVVPLHAPEMLWWAQKLSLEADSPFVRVDMLDSPSGPVFGEFTYSPGGTHKRTYVFSHKMLKRFDRLISAPGDSSDHLTRTPLDVRKSLSHPDPSHFKSWAGFAYNGGARGAERLHAFYKEHALACGPDDPRFEWYRRLSALWAGARDRLRPSKRGDEKGSTPALVSGAAPNPRSEVTLVP